MKVTKKSTRSEMVSSILLQRILDGEWAVEERLPTVDELNTLMPASRATIHKGIQSLVEDGYLRSRRGSGVYVQRNTFLRRILVHVGGGRLDADHLFAMAVTRKLEEAMMTADMQTELRLESNSAQLDDRLAREMAQRRFHGVISVQSNLPFQWLQRPEHEKVRLPMVHVGVHNACPSVFVDMNEFQRQALDAIPFGRKILYFARSGDESTGDGFVALAAPRGHATHLLTDSELAKFDASEEVGFRALIQAWKRLDGDFDAVVVPDDVMGKGVAQALLALGQDVPETIQVIVLTNLGVDLFYPVPITRIEVDTTEVVGRAINLLENSLEGRISAAEQPPRVLVKPRMRIAAIPA
ncbi:MAG: GntR family transcriptional regulator [Kiritimatiellia bacterium]